MPRLVSALCLAAVVVVGLSLQLVRQLPWTDAAGSVLYAMAACFAITLLSRGRPATVAGAAFVACVLVELAQLTGIPARLPALSLLLGSGFDPRDIGWYAVGSILGAGVMLLAHTATRRHSATQRHIA